MVFTFYSYKGGVGRSMALANIAEWLYANGVRVLMIDWDLEAPGLESFFYQSEAELDEVRRRPGLMDLLAEYRQQYARAARTSQEATTRGIHEAAVSALGDIEPWLHVVHAPAYSQYGGGLWLLPAGERHAKFADYAEAVADFDWAEFYADFEGEAFFDWLRARIAHAFSGAQRVSSGFADVALVDSRTGATEMGGVCTQQLADVVVAFCAPNMQNLLGVETMADAFCRPEIRDPRGGKPDVIIVPSRVDASELESRSRFEKRLQRVEAKFIPPILQSLKRSFWDLKIPYVPKFTYEEALTVENVKSRGRHIEAAEMKDAYRHIAATMTMLAPATHPLRSALAQELAALFVRKRVYVTAVGDLLLVRQSSGKFASRRALLERALRSRLETDAPDIDVWSPRRDPEPIAERSGEGEPAPAPDPHAPQDIADASALVMAITPPVLFESDRTDWLHARRNGVCVYGVYAGNAASSVPIWLRKVKLFEMERDFGALLQTLRSPCTALRAPFMAPELPSGYVDRPDILEPLKSVLLTRNGEPAAVRCVLHGLGGSGKSAIAAALCHDTSIVDAFDDGILWLPGGAKPDMRETLSRVNAALTGERTPFSTEHEAFDAVSARIASLNRLIVLDDVSNAADLAPLLRAARSSSFVITSRNVAVLTDAISIPVGGMTAEQAEQYLRQRLDVPVAPSSLQLDEAFSFPLFLQIASNVIAERLQHGDTLDRAVAYVRDASGAGRVEGVEAVARAIDATLLHVSPEARRRFSSMSELETRQPIAIPSLAASWNTSPAEAERYVQEMARFSLVGFDASAGVVSIHPVVNAYLEAYRRSHAANTGGGALVPTVRIVGPATPVTYNDGDERYGPFVSTRMRHSLELPLEFEIGITPVTNGQFAYFVRAGGYADDAFWPSVPRALRRRFLAGDGSSFAPSGWPSGDMPRDRAAHPVAGICYYEAVAFIHWLNEAHRRRDWLWILPSEDMWEFAARGDDGRAYPWGNEFTPDACNSAEQQIGTTTKVGQFASGNSPAGGHDFAGNVWEFVDAVDQPVWGCVLRGGSYLNTRVEVKSTLRLFGVSRDQRAPDFGFRCAQQPRNI